MRLLAFLAFLAVCGAFAWGTAIVVRTMSEDMQLGALLGFVWTSLLALTAAWFERWKNGSPRRQQPEHPRFPRGFDGRGE